MRLRLLVILWRVRFRLAPAWLRVQPKRRPVLASAVIVVLPALLTLYLIGVFVSHQSRPCFRIPAVTPGKPHLVCQQVNKPPGKP